MLKKKYGTLIYLYLEKTATTKKPMTGKSLSGIAALMPSSADAPGRALDDARSGYDLRVITCREMFHTESRTVAIYWLQAFG